MRRYLVMMVSLLAGLSLGSPVFADVQHRIVIRRDGSVTLNQTLIPNALRVEAQQDSLLVPIINDAASDQGTITVLVELPVVMPNDWEPRLRPSKCACPTTTERLSEQTYQLTVASVTRGASVSFEAHFNRGILALPASQRAVVGIERLGPWILGFALLILLGTLGLLGWMIWEMILIRKFQLTPTVTETPPNELSPVELSLIPSGKITSATIAAMIVHLAQRGYLTLVTQDKKFLLVEEKPLDLSGPGFALGSLPGDTISPDEVEKATHEGVTLSEKFLLSKLFVQNHPSTTQEELRVRFGRRLSSWKIGKVYAEIYAQVTKSGFFIRNPHLIHLRYRGIGISIFFVGLVGFIGSLFFPGDKLLLVLTWAVVASAGLIVTRMVPFLPLMTVLGQAEWARWAGFRLYLTNPTPIPEKVPTTQFFEYLGYALAFDVVDDWARRFGARTVTAPSWYLTEPPTKTVDEMMQELTHLIHYVANILAAIHEHTVR